MYGSCRKDGIADMKTSVTSSQAGHNVTSPGQLNEYIKVATPGSWLCLTAVFLLLFGLFIWGIFGKIDTKVRAAVVVKDGMVHAYVQDDDAQQIKAGEKLLFGDETYEVSSVSNDPLCVGGDFEEYIRYVGGFEYGDWVRQLEGGTADAGTVDGTYRAQVVTESLSPLSFLMP